MSRAYWCVDCGTISPDGTPPNAGCLQCGRDEKLTGWPLVASWAAVLGVAWGLLLLALYGVAWVLQ